MKNFRNYIMFLGFLTLVIIVLYMWYELIKHYNITGEYQGFILVGFITFILVTLIWMWIKELIKK